MAKYTEKKKASNRKWDAENLVRFSTAVSKEMAAEIKAAADAVGESVNGYIKAAIRAMLDQDKQTETDTK